MGRNIGDRLVPTVQDEFEIHEVTHLCLRNRGPQIAALDGWFCVRPRLPGRNENFWLTRPYLTASSIFYIYFIHPRQRFFFAEIMKLGQLLSTWRKQKELTLQQLADEIGVTASYISQIEHGKVSPSLATLKKLAKAVDRKTVDFFVDELIDDPIVLSEKEWTRVSHPHWDAHVRQLVRIVGNKLMQPFYTVIEPGGGTREPYSHSGEEFGIVLDGELTLRVGDDTHVVPRNSSFYYSSLIPHSWTNEGKEPCRVVWVISPPSW